jgi:RNA recognition motif-containing protein
MAFIKFSSSDEANLAVSIPKIEIRGFRVWVKYNQSFNEFSEKNDL